MLISDRKFLFCTENTKGSLELIEDAEVKDFNQVSE